MKDSQVLLFIDALEDDEAMVLVGEKRYRLPRALLPIGAKEGSWLRLSLHDSAVGAEIEKVRARLTGSDDGDDVKL